MLTCFFPENGNPIYLRIPLLHLADDGYGNLMRIKGNAFSNANDFTYCYPEWYSSEPIEAEVSYV